MPRLYVILERAWADGDYLGRERWLALAGDADRQVLALLGRAGEGERVRRRERGEDDEREEEGHGRRRTEPEPRLGDGLLTPRVGPGTRIAAKWLLRRHEDTDKLGYTHLLSSIYD